jgi:hypothetical protein
MAPQAPQIRQVASIELTLDQLPQYTITSGDEIELPVLGFDFQLTLFQRLPHGMDGPDGHPVTTYILVYQHSTLGHVLPLHRACLFVGGKPHITFIYKDQHRDDGKLIEYCLSRYHNQPILSFMREFDETEESTSTSTN